MIRAWLALVMAVGTLALGGCATTQQPEAWIRVSTDPVKTTRLQCWPLPAGTVPDFPLLAQRVTEPSKSGDPRLQMTFQFFGVDADEAARRLTDALASGGFRRAPSEAGSMAFAREGFGRVTVSVTPFEAGAHDAPVKGTITLDLPAAAKRAASKGTCPTPRRPLGT